MKKLVLGLLLMGSLSIADIIPIFGSNGNTGFLINGSGNYGINRYQTNPYNVEVNPQIANGFSAIGKSIGDSFKEAGDRENLAKIANILNEYPNLSTEDKQRLWNKGISLGLSPDQLRQLNW